MPTTQQLREQRANLWDQMQEVMEIADRENRDLTAEETQKYDRLEAELDKKGEAVARQERHEGRVVDYDRIEKPGAAGTPGADPAEPENRADELYAQAFNSWMRQGSGVLDRDEQAALRAGWVDGKELKNAGGVATGAAGGYTVPPAFRAKIVEVMNTISSMRQLAEVITTETGANLPWPTVDDTANEGAILGENTQVTEQDVVFGTNSIDAYMYTSKLVRISLQLLNDNVFDLEKWLAKALGTRIGRIQNRHFTVGTGTSQPDGIVTSAAVGVQGVVGQTLTVTYDNLVDLVDSIDAAYLEAGNAGFMMAQATRRVLRKLKDGQQRPLWEPSLQAGTPDRLMGYGLKMNNYMPAPGASAKSIVFGDIEQGYLIRDVSDFALLRLSERFADFLQVGFLGFQRSDGTLQNGAAVRTYQHSAT